MSKLTMNTMSESMSAIVLYVSTPTFSYTFVYIAERTIGVFLPVKLTDMRSPAGYFPRATPSDIDANESGMLTSQVCRVCNRWLP